MALQTLPSSLTADQPGATSPPVTDPNIDGEINKNSIPFSFLIAFLALFVAFMIVGLWARRVSFFVRRRLGLPIPEPRPKPVDIKPTKPILWDVSPGKSGDIARWSSMQPLSSWYRRETIDLPDDLCGEPAATHSPSLQAPLPRVPSITLAAPGRVGRVPIPPLPPPRYHNTSLVSDLRHARHTVFLALRNYFRPPYPGEARSTKTEGKVEAVQVAVFVAMPATERTKKRWEAEGGLTGEFAIGIADLPWEMGESVLDGDRH